MERRLYLRRILQVVAAVVAGAGLLVYSFRARTPKRSCREELVVQFARLPMGEYDLGVKADGYTNRCRLAQERFHGLSGSCDKSQGVSLLAGPGRLYLPVQAVHVDIDLSRNGVVLFARRLDPVVHRQPDGCTSTSILVQPAIYTGMHLGEQN